ncbi:uncharacterized protein C7orf26 homolog isoform X2 [Schistocerca americana]|uniref:uncharacterized protein C7orf26 homolog isoform X2 n=1 Tax=Schistocerca americana TaxID=7009 RepID=UPI001F504207|nr:uncharacterized protein C7orf26 homolog isoform X2 [Schistocerca americana]XP_049778238.1 integrator complex subunit 15 isoform X2 [Schistocerca cancellata]XP_049957428.1 integrator complex subunit 15 isoform X1 [Schistocerca serialis cubense]
MSVSGSELKSALRKTEFPFCAREALSRVEQLTQNTGRPPSIKHLDLAMDLMAEFIFCEVERRGGKRKKLTCIQELQLLEVLCDYFSFRGVNNDSTCNTVFMSLFPPTNMERCRFLAKLVSMAISTKNTPVLSATGIWMQQLGCTSKVSMELVRGLVKDYFVLVPKAVSVLQDLPQLAPHFTANFLTAVADMYGSEDKKNVTNPPPNALLEIITRWIAENPTLCAAALNAAPMVVTSVGAHSTPVTPFAGLFKWCILAPVLGWEEDSTHQYWRLQLALLESTLEQPCEGAVSARHLGQMLITPLLSASCHSRNRKCQQLALDRLAQAIQVLMAQNAIVGNTQELLSQLELLPENRLLSLVIKKHKVITIV